MKTAILIFNLLLAGVLGVEVMRYFGGGSPQLAVSTNRNRKHTAHGAVKSPAPKKTAMSDETAIQTILSNNIFNITRCPDAIGGMRGGSSSMVLLGVYRIGDKRGAIIQQNTRTVRMFQPFGGARQTQQRQIKPQQTFMQGETMDNGYVVSEIHDDRVVLTRNGGRMELRLELASRPLTQARAAAAARAARPTAQQMQQRMQFQQMMMMQQLMPSTNAMQRQMNQNRSGGGGGGNTRSSGSR